jgi:ribulose kinase
VAAGAYPDVVTAMANMTHAGQVIEPSGGGVAEYHTARRAVFHRMYDDFVAYRRLMMEEGDKAARDEGIG